MILSIVYCWLCLWKYLHICKFGFTVCYRTMKHSHRHPPINKRKRSSIQNNQLKGRFLDAESLCELLQNGSVANSSIPKGIKEDVYFLIENNNNVKKRLCGEKSIFEDHCGAWNSKASSTKKTVFHQVFDFSRWLKWRMASIVQRDWKSECRWIHNHLKGRWW